MTLFRFVPLLPALATLCACPVDLPAGDELDLACEQEQDCLEGFRCVDGLCVVMGQDAGQIDATGSADATGGDRDLIDSGAPDQSTPDGASPDGATADSATPDSATTDSATTDSATTDSAAADNATTDSATADSATTDSATADGAAPDAVTPDSAAPDTAAPDTAAPDAAAADTSCVGPDCWWDDAWGWRQRLTLDNSAHDEQLSDFPVLVVLDDTRIDYGVTHDNGHDLRFVDDDGVTVLAHEIEAWNEAGRSYVWVKVPQIERLTDADFIWLYYGHATPTPLQREAEVWSDGFQAVYHLNSNFTDSSASGFDATNHGSSTADGMIAAARELDGSSNYIDLGDDRPFLRDVGYGTLSAWIKADNTSAEAYVASISIDSSSSSTESSRAAFGVADYDFNAGGRATDGEGWDELRTSGDLAAVDTWYYYVAINDYVDEEIRIYVDGVLVDSGFGDYAANRSADSNATNSCIGAQDDGSGNQYDGVVDELRIATVNRSATWIAAQHQSMRDQAFVIYGDAEPR